MINYQKTLKIAITYNKFNFFFCQFKIIYNLCNIDKNNQIFIQ